MEFGKETRTAVLKDQWNNVLGAKYYMTLTEYGSNDNDDKGYNL